jgi:hypothetical protein
MKNITLKNKKLKNITSKNKKLKNKKGGGFINYLKEKSRNFFKRNETTVNNNVKNPLNLPNLYSKPSEINIKIEKLKQFEIGFQRYDYLIEEEIKNIDKSNKRLKRFSSKDEKTARKLEKYKEELFKKKYIIIEVINHGNFNIYSFPSKPEKVKKGGTGEIEKPDETKEFGETKEPSEIKEFGETEKPDETKEFDETKEPDETKEFDETKEPSEIKESGETEKPSKPLQRTTNINIDKYRTIFNMRDKKKTIPKAIEPEFIEPEVIKPEVIEPQGINFDMPADFVDHENITCFKRLFKFNQAKIGYLSSGYEAVPFQLYERTAYFLSMQNDNYEFNKEDAKKLLLCDYLKVFDLNEKFSFQQFRDIKDTNDNKISIDSSSLELTPKEILESEKVFSLFDSKKHFNLYDKKYSFNTTNDTTERFKKMFIMLESLNIPYKSNIYKNYEIQYYITLNSILKGIREYINNRLPRLPEKKVDKQEIDEDEMIDESEPCREFTIIIYDKSCSALEVENQYTANKEEYRPLGGFKNKKTKNKK